MDYQACLQEIEALQGLGIHYGLDTMQEACTRLGHPELAVPTVQIAGTNGKGSTAAMLATILHKAGYKTGLTISPHLVSIRERLQVNGEFISKDEFVRLHLFLKEKVGHLPLTYFEWLVLMAFVFFAESRVDCAVLEVGLGGRWDATSVAQPLLAAITNVSLDHQAILGRTEALILTEKMQIIKVGTEAVTAISEPQLLTQLQNHCNRLRVPLHVVTNRDAENLHPSLAGDHQKINAAVAVALARLLNQKNFEIPEEAIKSGIAETIWPGRLEVVGKSPQIVLDGAHNPAGIEVLADYLKNKNQKIHLVFTALNDRPAGAMLSALKPFCEMVTLAKLQDPRALSDQALHQLAQDCGLKGNILEITPEKWQSFASAVPPDQTVLVTGSLYLISKVRAILIGETL